MCNAEEHNQCNGCEQCKESFKDYLTGICRYCGDIIESEEKYCICETCEAQLVREYHNTPRS